MTSDFRPYLDTLASQAHPEGGWGYVPDQLAHLEPTCLALIALGLDRERFQPAIDRGLQVLRQSQLSDGTFRLARGRHEAVWPTSLALFAQSVLDVPLENLRPIIARLLSLHGSMPEKDPEIAKTLDIDCHILGWSWSEGNFAWVEPTSWAILALRRVGLGNHPRVEEGRRLLFDRALDEGGVNYGSRCVFGKTTEPIPTPTALMMLALQGADAGPRLDATLAYLQRQAGESDDLEHLCWAKLALDTYRDRAGIVDFLSRLDERIIRAHQDRTALNWLRPAPLREALTALALAADANNPFRLAQVSNPAEPVQPAAANVKRRPWGERIRSAFRGIAVNALVQLRPLELPAVVHIARQSDYQGDLAGTLQRQYEAFRDRVPLAGKRVVLKPNLVEYHRDRVINTNPNVVAAAIELCKREGAAEVIVAEGPGHWRNVEYLVQASGLGDVLRHYRVPFVDLNQDEPVKRPNLGRLTKLDFLYLARTIDTADVLISLPKLKTHHWVGATLSLKNLFGTMPGICYGWPKNELHWRGIENSIIDIALTRAPDLAIVDGIIGMEGDGPLNGTAKPVGALIMGRDPLAVDATCCRLMQLDPEQMPYLMMGYCKKLGLLREKEIHQAGEAIADLAQPFETLEHFQKIYLGRSA
jgi:uncharacterized protein (DUF362 family)